MYYYYYYSNFSGLTGTEISSTIATIAALCDGCGSQFSTGHALDCRNEGLVIQRHNVIRDALGDLASIAYKDVVRELVVR